MINFIKNLVISDNLLSDFIVIYTIFISISIALYVFVFENTSLKLSSELIKLYKKDIKLNLFYSLSLIFLICTILYKIFKNDLYSIISINLITLINFVILIFLGITLCLMFYIRSYLVNKFLFYSDYLTNEIRKNVNKLNFRKFFNYLKILEELFCKYIEVDKELNSINRFFRDDKISPNSLLKIFFSNNKKNKKIKNIPLDVLIFNFIDFYESILTKIIEYKRDEIAFNIYFEFYSFLKLIFIDSYNKLDEKLKKGILYKIQGITKNLTKDSIMKDSVLKFYIFYDWYSFIAEDEIDLDLIYIFNKTLFDNLKIIIRSKHDELDLFKTYLSFIHEDISLLSLSDNVFENAINKFYQFSNNIDYKKVNDFKKEYQKEISIEKIKTFEKDLINLINELNININKNEIQKIKEEAIEKYINRFKYIEFIDLNCALIPYLIFKNKINWIKELLEYNQPKDSYTIWLNPRLLIGDPNSLLDQYYKRNIKGKYEFHEDHHESEKYFEKYFLLMMALFLNSNKRIEFSKLSRDVIEQFKTEIKEKFLPLINEIDYLFKGFFGEDYEKMIEQLKNYLENVEKEIEILERKWIIEDELSIDMIKDWQNKIIESYENYCLFKKLFKYKNIFKELVYQNNKEIVFGHIPIDRELFLEYWKNSIDTHIVKSQLGFSLAYNEDEQIFFLINQESEEIVVNDYDELLNNIKDFINTELNDIKDLYIFSSDNLITSKIKNYRPKQQNENSIFKDIYDFNGHLFIDSNIVPIFNLRFIQNKKIFYLIDFNRIKSFNQYFYKFNNEKECFKFEFIDLARDKEYLMKILDKYPDKKTDYESKVIIQIKESFDIKFIANPVLKKFVINTSVNK
mgnify:CR=1 FL=1